MEHPERRTIIIEAAVEIAPTLLVLPIMDAAIEAVNENNNSSFSIIPEEGDGDTNGETCNSTINIIEWFQTNGYRIGSYLVDFAVAARD